MRGTILTMVVLLVFPGVGLTDEFSVTDNLAESPKSIEKLIYQRFPNYSKCKIAGKAFDLDGDKKHTDHIATAKGCGGSGGDPIFVVLGKANSYEIVLDYIANTLETTNHTSNGLYNLVTYSGAGAGRELVCSWKYNGKEYIREKLDIVEE